VPRRGARPWTPTRDPVVDRHDDGLGERHHEPLEELVVVGSERVRREVLAYVAVRRLFEVGARREEAREEGQPPRAVAAFLAELPLRCRLGFLAGCPPPPGSSQESARARWRNWRTRSTCSGSTKGTTPTVMPTWSTGYRRRAPVGSRQASSRSVSLPSRCNVVERGSATRWPWKPPRDWPPGHGLYLCYCPRLAQRLSFMLAVIIDARFPQSQADILTGSVSGSPLAGRGASWRASGRVSKIVPVHVPDG